MAITVFRKDPSGREGNFPLDLESRLFQSNIVILDTPINNFAASEVITQLLFLRTCADNTEDDIQFYINSSGGSIIDGLAILDTMWFLMNDEKNPRRIATVCVGKALHIASVLLMSGTRGMRFALPHCCIMLPEPVKPRQIGFSEELEKATKESFVGPLQGMLEEIIAAQTQKPREEVAKLLEQKMALTAQQAVEYGIIDKICNFGVRVPHQAVAAEDSNAQAASS